MDISRLEIPLGSFGSSRILSYPWYPSWDMHLSRVACCGRKGMDCICRSMPPTNICTHAHFFLWTRLPSPCQMALADILAAGPSKEGGSFRMALRLRPFYPPRFSGSWTPVHFPPTTHGRRRKTDAAMPPPKQTEYRTERPPFFSAALSTVCLAVFV